MARPARIHSKGGEPHRIHFLVEWADHRSLTQADIAKELGVDKSTVSRWFKGSLPAERHMLPLVGLLGISTSALFRDPHDNWLSEFFAQRTREEKERAQRILREAFPNKKTG